MLGLLDMNDMQKLLDEVILERDEARKCAEQMRDLYAAEVDESIEAFPWPWEADE